MNQITGKQARIMLVFLAVLLISFFLLSELFVLTHLNHEHDSDAPDEACSVCIQIHIFENLRLSAAVCAVFSLAVPIAAAKTANSVPCKIISFTPVSLKTRLNA